MGNVVFVEVLPVIDRLEPELRQCFPLRVWPHNPIHANETCETDAVEAFSVEDGRRVADPFGNIGGEIECADRGLGCEPQDSLSDPLDEAKRAFLLRALQRHSGQAADATGHAGSKGVAPGSYAV